MACLLLVLILATTALTVPTKDKLLLANAARTSPAAEAFWRAALPGAPMPEAIRDLLVHARAEATTVANDVKLKHGAADPPPINFAYDDYRAAASRRNGAAPPSPGVLKLGAGALNNDAGATWADTVFFLEDAVRVGGSLPLAATDAPAAGLAPPRLYTVRAVRAVMEGSSSIVVCRRSRDAAVAYGCRAAATMSGPARVYTVDVAGGRGNEGVTVVATVAVVCHTDTSHWDTGHVALRLLGVKPGGAPVCHAQSDAQVLAIEKDEIIPVSP